MFSKAIEDAQKVPAGAPGATPADPFDLFATSVKPEIPDTLVDTSPAPGTIPGSPRIQLDYYARRFFIGRELVAIDENQKIYEPVDETPELKEVMDLCLQGKAMILKRLESIGQSGSVCIWMEWGVYKTPTATTPAERGYMMLSELKSPHVHTPEFEGTQKPQKSQEPLPSDPEAVSAFPPEDAPEELEEEAEEDRSAGADEEDWDAPDPDAPTGTPDPDAEVIDEPAKTPKTPPS